MYYYCLPTLSLAHLMSFVPHFTPKKHIEAATGSVPHKKCDFKNLTKFTGKHLR